jgi:hypothetical protein
MSGKRRAEAMPSQGRIDSYRIFLRCRLFLGRSVAAVVHREALLVKPLGYSFALDVKALSTPPA